MSHLHLRVQWIEVTLSILQPLPLLRMYVACETEKTQREVLGQLVYIVIISMQMHVNVYVLQVEIIMLVIVDIIQTLVYEP